MDKYQLMGLIEVMSTLYVISVILISAIFNNYLLLFLILLVGLSSETRDAILRSRK